MPKLLLVGLGHAHLAVLQSFPGSQQKRAAWQLQALIPPPTDHPPQVLLRPIENFPSQLKLTLVSAGNRRNHPIAFRATGRARLQFINTGDKAAILHWGRICFRSRLAWKLKDTIDRRYVSSLRTMDFQSAPFHNRRTRSPPYIACRC